MCSWTLQHPDIPADYVDIMRHLQRMQSGLVAHHGTNEPELLLRINSNHTATPEMQSTIASVAPSIVHLRVLKSLPQCLRNLPPLTALRTLEFCVPNNPYQVPLLQAAVSTLCSLEALHIFSSTSRSTQNVGNSLQVLSACCNITSLRVVTEAHVISIESHQLRYIKRLSLGHLVCFDRPPTQLQHLQLQSVQHNLDMHVCMLTQLQQMALVPSLEIEACSSAALLHLPSTLVSLTLHEPFNQDDVLDRGEISNQGKADLHQVFERLPALQVLAIGNLLFKLCNEPFPGHVPAVCSYIWFPRLPFGYPWTCRSS